MSQLRKVTSFILVSSILAVKASHPAKPQNPKEEKVKRTASSFCALLLRVLFGSINGHVLCQIIALLLSFSAFSLHKVHVQSYSEHRARKRPQRGQSSLVILLHCCQWMDTDTEVCGRFASYQPITAPEQQKGGSSAREPWLIIVYRELFWLAAAWWTSCGLSRKPLAGWLELWSWDTSTGHKESSRKYSQDSQEILFPWRTCLCRLETFSTRLF